MSVALADLQQDLSRALAAEDFDAAARTRRLIAEGYPGSDEAAEARYRLGLDALYRARDLDRAAQELREATRTKHKTWSPAARVSLGLILLRQGKLQQAVFELRRVAGIDPPSLLAAQASGLVVIALRENGKQQDAERARKQHLTLLGHLIQSPEPTEAAIARFMLGMEHKHDGERARARALLTEAVKSGALPRAEARAAQAALREV